MSSHDLTASTLKRAPFIVSVLSIKLITINEMRTDLSKRKRKKEDKTLQPEIVISSGQECMPVFLAHYFPSCKGNSHCRTLWFAE